MIRRYGESVRTDKTYRLRPGAYAILWSGRDMLATFQQDPEPELQLPGGGIDPGENTLPALHREVMEETGWHISNVRRLGAFRRFTFMPEYGFWAEKLCHIYLARPSVRISEPTETGHSAVWLKPSDAAKKLGNDGDRAFVTSFFGV